MTVWMRWSLCWLALSWLVSPAAMADRATGTITVAGSTMKVVCAQVVERSPSGHLVVRLSEREGPDGTLAQVAPGQAFAELTMWFEDELDWAGLTYIDLTLYALPAPRPDGAETVKYGWTGGRKTSDRLSPGKAYFPTLRVDGGKLWLVSRGKNVPPIEPGQPAASWNVDLQLALPEAR